MNIYRQLFPKSKANKQKCSNISVVVFLFVFTMLVEKTTSIQQDIISKGTDLMQRYKAKGLFFSEDVLYLQVVL